MGYRRGLSKRSRLSVLRDHLLQNLKAALDRSKLVQPFNEPVLLTNTTNPTISDTPTTLLVPDTPSLPQAAGTKSLIPNWSYEESSTAAAIIFTTIAVTALVFLICLSAQKIRRSWARRQVEHNTQRRSDGEAKNGSKPASGSARETVIFSSGTLSTSSQNYIVEQRGGSVSRVYREGRRSPHMTSNSMACLPAQPKRAVASNVRQKYGVPKPVQARKMPMSPGSRQVVVTQSLINHATSMRASPGRREASESEKGGKEVGGSKSSVAMPALQRSTSPVVKK
ncbi:hypothetical protein BJX96DRAFT_176444 [Aspergillus floccosus]